MADLADMLDDLEGELRPAQASELSAKQLVEELERRGIKPTGFPEDDQKKLQKAFNEEFELEKADRIRERREALEKKRAEEEALRLQRFLEKCAREEAEALQADARAAFFADLAKHNATPAEMVLRTTPNAVRAFVKTLGTCTSLRYLDLCNCGLADDVGAEIGAVLRTNTSLQTLELDFNRFGPRTAQVLGTALANNGSLKRLSMAGCRLTGEDPAKPDYSGIAALAAALTTNTGLVSVNLFRVGLGPEGGRMIVDAIAGNTNLVDLSVDPTDGMTATDMAGIGEILRANSEANVKRDVEGKKARAAARKAAVEEARAKAEAEAIKNEEEWIAQEMEFRRLAREQVAFEKYAAERKAEMEREKREKERWERMKAEAAEAAKKKK